MHKVNDGFNYTHWHCLVPQKGRGWLIKYWQMFDLILASFLQGEGMVQRMDGWHGRWLPNISLPG